MPSRSVKACFKCDKPFRAFRIKHHCSYCGLVFCGQCIHKNAFVGTDIELEKSCQTCIDSVSRNLFEAPSLEELVSESCPDIKHLDQSSSLVAYTETSAAKTADKVNELVARLNEAVPAEWEQVAAACFENRTRVLLAEADVSEEWVQPLQQLVAQAVHTVCPSVHYRRDRMDINEYIRVVTVSGMDSSASRYFNGVLLKKNAAHKKMHSHIETPKILFLRGGTEYSEGEAHVVSIERLVNQEAHFTDFLVRKIEQLQVQVVVNESTFSQTVINHLAEKHITAFIRVKLKHLKLVARSTQGQVLDSIDRTTNTGNCLGECQRLVQYQFGNSRYYCFEDPSDSTLAGSILLAGPEASELRKVRHVVQQLLVEYRNLVIEKHFFSALLMEPVPGMFSALHTTRFPHKFIVTRSLKLCKNPEDCDISCYSADDQSLGDFLVDLTRTSEDSCPVNNNHSLGSHRLHYLAEGGRVRLTINRISYEVQGISMIRECRGCTDRQDLTPFVTKILWEYSLNKFLSNLVNSLQLQTKAKMCKHEFFQNTIFKFRVKAALIQVEYQPYTTYDLKESPAQSSTEEIYQDLVCQSNLRLFEATKICFEALALQCKDLLVEVTTKLSEEEVRSMWEHLRKQAKKVNNAISTELATLVGLSVAEFNAKESFLSACDFKVTLEQIKGFIRKLKHSCRSSNKASGEDGHSSLELSRPRLYAGSVEKDEFLTSPEFTVLKTASLTTLQGIEPIQLSVREGDSASIIAHTLNSVKYYEEVSSALPKTELHEVSETELLRGSIDHFVFKFSSHEGLPEAIPNPELWRVYGAQIQYRVKVYNPRQFHCIRLHCCGPNFLHSMAQSLERSAQLGKKGSFKYSHDSRYMLKSTEEKEFKMFLDIAPNYFRHVCKAFYHSMPSLLVKALGAFKVQVKNLLTGKSRAEYILIYENLVFGMTQPVECYDLKGTTNHRRRAKEGDGKTKMDLNFVEECGGLPLVLAPDSKRLLDTSIWNDTIFLAKQNIIDYSLLVVLSQGKLRLGLIDYMEQYTFEKALESKYKRYIDNDNPTITHTKMYKQRFREYILQKYFIAF